MKQRLTSRSIISVAIALVLVDFVDARSPIPYSIRNPGTSALASVTQDLRASVRARKALNSDSELQRFNLGVRMSKGTATVWGPVPSGAYFDKVRRKLLDVPGVFAVRNQLYVERFELEDGVEGPLLPPPSNPVIVRSASPDRQRGVLSHLALPPRKRFDASPVSSYSRGTIGVGLLPPIVAPEFVRPEKPVLTHPIERIHREVRTLLDENPRYRAFRWELFDSRIVLHGPSHRGAELMEFAQKVRAIEGVERVALRFDTPR